MGFFRRSAAASSPALAALLALSLADAPKAAGDPRLAALERALDSRDSATETLRLWCAQHQGGGGEIHAVREGAEKPPSSAVLRLLGARSAGGLRFRHVRLVCGGTTLSVADNWYRADALSPAMNAALDSSEAPFGKVVAPLGLHRRTISSERPQAGSGFVLVRRAVLTNDRGQPFSVVEERYTAAMVGGR